MAKKSELADLTRRIREMESRLGAMRAARKDIDKRARRADEPVEKPLVLELKVARARRDLMRAESRWSHDFRKRAQLKLALESAEKEQAEALPAAGPQSEPLPFPGESEPAVHPI